MIYSKITEDILNGENEINSPYISVNDNHSSQNYKRNLKQREWDQ